MNLAKGRNGKIGRQIPGQGLQAKIVQPSGGGYHRNLYLSEGQIAQDQHYFKAKDAQSRALGAARIEQARINRIIAASQKAKNLGAVAAYQRLAKVNPMNERLKLHYARQMTMPQSAKVAGTLYHAGMGQGVPVDIAVTGATSGYSPKPVPPADFSNSGANMHLIPGTESRGSVVWSSDFRRHMIKGNPLTRDGEYGPKVTDYDRFVRGNDVYNNPDAPNYPIAGNTMVGKYEGMGRRFNYGLNGFGQDPSSDPSSVDFSYFDTPDTSIDTGAYDVQPLDTSTDVSSTDVQPIDTSTDTTDYSTYDQAMPVTGNEAPTDAELAAATPEQPGFFSKVWTAAEVQADKSLPSLLQQQMQNAIKAGGKVGTSPNGTIIVSQPGKPPVAVGIQKSAASVIPPIVIYASVGLVAIGLLMMLMKGGRRPAAVAATA